MQIIRIKCPKCSTMLEVKNPSGERERTVPCPNCKAKLLVKFNDTSRQTTDSSSSNDDEDEFGTSIMSGIVDTTIGKLLYNGKVYPLQLGVNTIGRKASTSKAAVQIETADRSMSRLHSIIEVSRQFDGSVRSVIRNADNKNKTFVGGQELIGVDRIVLCEGDIIKMGDAVLTFIKDTTK